MMKKIFVIFINLLAVTITVALPRVAYSEADGFRGIKWGTDISTLKDMQYLRTGPSNEGIKIYSRKNDELKIGGAELESIEYEFWQDKFSCVVITTKGDINFSALKDATFEKFGRGYKGNRFMEKYNWGGITRMLLDYNEISEEGELIMGSEETIKQREKQDAENAKKGAETGF